MNRNVNLEFRPLPVVVFSSLLAFVISQQQAAAEQAPWTSPGGRLKAAASANAADVATKAKPDFAAAGAYRVDAGLATCRDTARMRD